jgi:Tripartite tricarboxylate transporter TctB family
VEAINDTDAGFLCGAPAAQGGMRPISTGPVTTGRVRAKSHSGDTPLQERFTLKRDYYAGGLMLLLGVGAAVTGAGYKFGSLARMGPGFMPVMLGIVLAFLGILIAGTALGSTEPDNKKFLPDNPQWFGWLCILGGPVLFIILGEYGGMIPAVFACVFVCALGDKTATYKSSAILAAGVTVFGVLLFHYLLSIPFPLLRGVNL